ncbi:MAG: tetratricopeptide repeat protein, partial [Proteobacteria bacterium]|nr:tetratricopeptide repeat protein [Pseudomonadota bacterium]
NMPWEDFSEAEKVQCTAFCRGYIEEAVVNIDSASPIERALINALSLRIQKPYFVSQSEFDEWDDEYAIAMRKVNYNFPDSTDAAALFIEAMMIRTPWNMWDVTTKLPPERADTYEAISLCEKEIKRADALSITPHPAILHWYIHLMEMSPNPELAMDSAKRLAGLSPDAGHLHHMPGHIYLLCGEYEKAKSVSEEAIRVNRKYLSYAGPYNYYTANRCHDLHLMIYACMFLGQLDPAIAAAEEICENLTSDVIDLTDKPFIAATLEGYFSMKMHVLVRFGAWQDILDTPFPEDPKLYCVSTSMFYYARTIAQAALKNIEEAKIERASFYQSLKLIAPTRKLFNNSAIMILKVGELMLEGELSYHEGKIEVAYEYLRESVRVYDKLHYSEPWPWMHPPRHALGALLLEQGHYQEAEEIYRADLGMNETVYRCAQHPNNVWALHGLSECLIYRGETEEVDQVQSLLTKALKKADPSIKSSCCCRGYIRKSVSKGV